MRIKDEFHVRSILACVEKLCHEPMAVIYYLFSSKWLNKFIRLHWMLFTRLKTPQFFTWIDWMKLLLTWNRTWSVAVWNNLMDERSAGFCLHYSGLARQLWTSHDCSALKQLLNTWYITTNYNETIFVQWGHFCDFLFYISMTYLHRAASGEYIENQIVVYPIEIIVLFLWSIP